jgi:small GTP-binding protein
MLNDKERFLVGSLENQLGFRLTKAQFKTDDEGHVIGLDLANARISSFPDAVLALSCLGGLNLSGNQIKILPEELFSRKVSEKLIDATTTYRGVGLSLHGNPLESPPIEIVGRGLDAVRSYYLSLRQEPRRPLHEVKVIFVGDGGAGKTSLIKRFVSNDFDPKEPQTHGITITNHSATAEQGRVTLNIWDFGGQEIMHATHQFFLSKRSLYVLVLDCRKDDKTEYWLKHIESFGGESPVLVVLNKIDENPGFEVNRRFLQAKYPSIQGFIRVSCAAQTGIKVFKSAVAEALLKVQILETAWPESWFRLKQRLGESTCDFITYADFKALCVAERIVDQQNQSTLVDFLHDLGTVLHFGDFELLDTHVLNPHWVTNAVYRIINSEKVAEQKGLLKTSQLKSILEPMNRQDFKYPPEKFAFILSLMLKFELCFRIDDNKILIPDLLDVQEPEIDFDFKDALLFRFDYDFLPRSIMPRFIVRLHRDIEVNHCWRTGVALSDAAYGARAVVKADDRERRIHVWVTGDGRREYFTAIQFTFRQIHSSFEKLQVIERVPMPDSPDVAVSQAHLLRLQKMGINEFVPDGSDRQYSVAKLLGNVETGKTKEEEILALLRKLHEQSRDQASFMKAANDIVQLQPNLFGIGVNLNKLIEKVLHRKVNE